MKLFRKDGDDRTENSLVDLKRFLSTPDQPLTMQEFKEFWDSCSDEEKAEFKNTELPTSE